jgi:Domain of unknown function (DUF4349)
MKLIASPLPTATPAAVPVPGSRKGRARLVLVLFLVLIGTAGLAGALPGRPRAATGASHGRQRLSLLAPSGAADIRAATTFGAATAPQVPANKAGSGANGPALPAGLTGQSAKIEENGSITLVVAGKQIQADLSRVMTIAVSNGGFVSGTDTQSAMPGTPAQGTVTLDVPEASFGTVLSEVKGFGKVAMLTTSATDVTGQYVDLQARINALEDSRQQYLTIMTKATTIGGILAVESQLDNLQSQLEQLQGQQQVLDNETTYATLTVTLTQKVVVPPPPRPESGLLKAWNAAVSGFVAGFEGVVRVAGPLFFALLLLAALVVLGRWAWKFRPGRSS